MASVTFFLSCYYDQTNKGGVCFVATFRVNNTSNYMSKYCFLVLGALIDTGLCPSGVDVVFLHYCRVFMLYIVRKGKG